MSGYETQNIPTADSPQALALDLGSTRIKGAMLHGGRVLGGLVSEASPPLTGEGLIREGDPTAYLDAVRRTYARLQFSGELPLGIASQRSSFLIWDATGKPLTPMISWQDRRADEWCRRFGDARPDITATTGLLLSPHYVGPKLASILERDVQLELALTRGAKIGTLDTYLIWMQTEGRVHQTDPTMAARTLMFDLRTGTWSEDLCRLYSVPLRALPEIVPTSGRDVQFDRNVRLRASVADQASAALALLHRDPDQALVSLGTGAFVLRPRPANSRPPENYLRAPVLGLEDGQLREAWEGTVNGAGTALDRYPRTGAPMPIEDPSPDAYCLPDVAGIGAPFWVADRSFLLSPAAERLHDDEKRRIVVEGLLFRIHQILNDLFVPSRPRRIFLSGGPSADPAFAPGLAALAGLPVERLELGEAGLLGAARLAAGLDPYADPDHFLVSPGPAGNYLPEKYMRWRTWIDSLNL